MDYIIHILIFILIFAILVESLNLIMGYIGVISMGHAVFSGLGAYTAALISIHLGYNFLIGMIAGFILASIIGALLAIPSLRVKNEYLIVFTVGFQMIGYEVMLTARNITQGAGGISNIPAPNLFGIWEFTTPLAYLPLVLFITAVCFAIVWRVTHSPFGRILKAIREDETACRALGKNSLQFKVIAFALGGGIAAIGGSTLAYYISFISPLSFSVDVSVSLIVMVVLGGEANFWAPLVGATILVGLPEILQFIPGAAGIIDALREVLYGIILIVFMCFRPQGILPEYSRRMGKVRIPAEFLGGNGGGDLYKEFSKPPAKEKSGHPILEVKGLNKAFGGLQAVADVSFSLPAGQITGLIGPNGCGKTTIFNLITGHLIPDKGMVEIQGLDVTGQPPYKVVKSGLARSWQDVRIFHKMTVLNNVLAAFPNQRGENLALLFLQPRRVAYEEINNYRKAVEYIKLVGLLDKASQLAGSLSTAEQKLVALARLLATECPVLLLDEPTASLDMESVERIINLIRRIWKEGEKTILLVEHNLDVVRGLVEKAYFMSEGVILAYGKPSELMEDPKLAEVYFGVS